MNKKKKNEDLKEQSKGAEKTVNEDVISDEMIDSEEAHHTKKEDKEEIEEANDEIQEEESEPDENTRKLLRLQADFLNFKNRTEKEKARIYSSAIEDIIMELLPVMDNFERAIQTEHDNNSFKDGIVMIYNQLKTAIEKKGVEEIPSLGEKFNPNIHHAVASQETEDVEADVIIEVLQKGYQIYDKVIRPSMVKISK
ncbi:MAG: nucleotide exchange factor GrpE [Tissierellales bacterium]|nr:nucleotide exchange factor GrpE [Tissierellales bacterium]MBN2827022.1 nucleotide exchange factor GrpE [Tissierellales bacterium]